MLQITLVNKAVQEHKYEVYILTIVEGKAPSFRRAHVGIEHTEIRLNKGIHGEKVENGVKTLIHKDDLAESMTIVNRARNKAKQEGKFVLIPDMRGKFSYLRTEFQKQAA